MNDTNKMLRTLINGQSSIKSELLIEIKKLEKNLSKKIDENTKMIKQNGKRLDMIGKTLAVLFEELKARVQKIEQKMTFA